MPPPASTVRVNSGRQQWTAPADLRQTRNLEDPAMPAYRSRTTTHGRNMAGARGLWRATGMKDGDFGKPIIAIVDSLFVLNALAR